MIFIACLLSVFLKFSLMQLLNINKRQITLVFIIVLLILINTIFNSNSNKQALIFLSILKRKINGKELDLKSMSQNYQS